MGAGPSRYDDLSDVDLAPFAFLKQLAKDDIARFFSNVVRPCPGPEISWRDYFSHFRTLHESRSDDLLQRRRRCFHPACTGFAMIKTQEPMRYEQLPQPAKPESPPLVPDNYTEASDSGSDFDEGKEELEEGREPDGQHLDGQSEKHTDASEQPVRVRVVGWDPECVSPMFFGYVHTTAAEHDQHQAEERRQSESAELQAICTALATRETRLQELITQHKQRSAIREDKLKKMADSYELSRRRAKEAFEQSLRMLSGSQAEMLKRKYVSCFAQNKKRVFNNP